MRQAGWLLVAAVLLVATGCGPVPPTAGSDASSSRTASPNVPSPTPSGAPSAFLPGDCTYQASGGTQTQPAPDTFKTVISVPQGWTQRPTSGFGATIFQLTAPSSYLNSPTTIDIASLFQDVPYKSPEELVAGITQVSYTIVGQIQTCSVGGDSAAFAQYTLAGGRAGYLVLWVHLSVAYSLTLEGAGGLDPRAIQDAKGVLASLSWR